MLSSMPGWMSTILQNCSGGRGNPFLTAFRMISGVIVVGTAANNQLFVPRTVGEDCRAEILSMPYISQQNLKLKQHIYTLKPWPNGDASVRKLETCVYLRLRLAGALGF